MSAENTHELLLALTEAAAGVVPIPITCSEAELVEAPIQHVEMGVLIGVIGQVRGRLLIVGNTSVFGGVAEAMFGMKLEGDMLESFVGELGNMIAGSTATQASMKGISIDITPPTVIVGDTKFTGFQKANRIQAQIGDAGAVEFLLIIED